MAVHRSTLVSVVLLAAACAPSGDGDVATITTTADPPPATAPAQDRPTAATPASEPPPGREAVTVIAAGDISRCDTDGDSATAALLDRLPGTIVTLGDNAYDDGSREDFARCYDPTWGRHRDRTRPAIGNHEYGTDSAAGYFDYFGDRAGEPGEGWYSFDLGDRWHAIALNSNCWAVGGCGPGSPQHTWLVRDLAENRDRNVLAYWHTARFSSGRHGSSTDVAPLFDALYAARADIVLTAHDHSYERFAPVDPEGRRAPARGVRTFVVGTGGSIHYPFDTPPLPATEARSDDTFGLLELTLHPDRYVWRFVPADGGGFTDSGSSPVVP